MVNGQWSIVSKSEIKTFVPDWIKQNKKLTREFLASYFGSELQIIRPGKYGKGFECIRLYLTKDRKLEGNGAEFAKEICKLTNSFGVKTSEEFSAFSTDDLLQIS